MSISRHNYETFLIDYLDGNLDAVQVSELLLFLEQNPDIREEFEGISGSPLPADTVTGFDASSLKKPAYSQVRNVYDTLLIAQLENDLTSAQQKRLEDAFSKYPQLKADEALFALTKLQPENIAYPGKQGLRKRTRVVVLPVISWARIAATVILVSGAAWWFADFNASSPDRQTAVVLPSRSGTEGNAVSRIPAHLRKAGKEKPVMTSRPEAPLKKIAPVQAVKQSPMDLATIDAVHRPEISPVHAQLHSPDLQRSTISFPAYSQPEVYASNATTFRERFLAQIIEQKNRLIGRHEDGRSKTLLEAINDVTGADIRVDKDSSGRLKHFEIAGLGFEWSQSR